MAGPSTLLQPIGFFIESEGASTSRTNVVFPDPETPVTTVRRSSGIGTVIPFRLRNVAL